MIPDRKGEGGFAESITIMIVVVISLTAFLAILPAAFSDNVREERMPVDLLDNISISGSEISFGADIENAMSERGFSAFRIVIKVIGTDRTYEVSAGSGDQDGMMYRSGTVMADVDGRRMNAGYEMAVWR